ncbi:formyltetrahydrofolate deformylase [Chitinophaga terrae (ex Kim and Jung 2007)]|uniref:Formyltetrahydrofolate deformylase n=1 Tax=Chitinophaga terrae (ex Kim and Jung 2007) TaxID=408074 RepID=A0A1H4FX25_9BACT|nr:formyltetrahydrofolate deformylase [Chitinophaga terrae (ex Kim and Jung 2007)]MDQ0108178.1 formyltetrahydrofolate deformylase [Chitinophaga terrae (ex Kim and Jung 2007)]SEB01681.1 formyltetrahydrofolate deformylase [Chitinophaga terrae (ex Kim and Jung 2007)]
MLFSNTQQPTACLLICCPDKPGIVAGVSQFLYQSGANILDASQHSTDPREGLFFMRMEFLLPNLDKAALEAAFQAQVATPLQMEWTIDYSDRRKQMAIMVSAYDHCLLELLWRWKSGELQVDIPLVISNHRTLEKDVANFGIPFHHIPVTAANKAEQEAKTIQLLHDHQVDFTVLARYMQILSANFVKHFPQRIINIHHSFLPAFAGAKPYQNAYARGVKLIGATAHYVTDELDEGPIIEQDVARVSHKHTVEDLVMLGRDIERQVLTRAVKAHIDDRVILHGNKTIVF